MNRQFLRRTLALLLCAALCLSAALSFAEGTQRGLLLENFTDNMRKIASSADFSTTMYSGYTEKNISTALPEKFDLRENGVVPKIRNQGNWGTCWGFASIAASEISILSSLGLTCEEYKLLYGEELDLSEKHLAWFGNSHLPLLSDFPEGEYPYMASQAGEGLYHLDEDTLGGTTRYSYGGQMAYSSTSFSNGIGPVSEQSVPYQAADGTASTASDWSLSEDLRYIVYYELLESSMLPSPSTRDENGAYLYNASATQAIKRELLSGRGVAIAYHADQAMDPRAQTNMALDALQALGFSEEDLDYVNRLMSGEAPDMSTMGENELSLLCKLLMAGTMGRVPTDEEIMPLKSIFMGSMSGESAVTNPDDMQAASEALMTVFSALNPQAAAAAQQETVSDVDPEIAVREALEKLGLSYDDFKSYVEKRTAAESINYINTDTYAQYTDTVYAPVTHGVCIIGWDDHYSADNFLADHRPPADGAWIVRNSWGENYGNKGYFYLSYYDQTIVAPETFRFATVSDGNDTSEMSILSYDLMPADAVSNLRTDTPVYSANIFTNNETTDQVLSHVSLLTSEHNVTATVNVYLLKDDCQNPEDGVLLDTVTSTYEYAGYHRVDLHQNYVIKAGQKISVVQTQRMTIGSDTIYTTPYTCGISEDLMTLNRIFETNDSYRTKSWAESRVNPGESFLFIDGQWTDWYDLLAELSATSPYAPYFNIDNLCLKAYLYPLAELKELHSLGRNYSYFGVNAHICDECGYTIVEYGK